jgi:hypothetical protein
MTSTKEKLKEEVIESVVEARYLLLDRVLPGGFIVHWQFNLKYSLEAHDGFGLETDVFNQKVNEAFDAIHIVLMKGCPIHKVEITNGLNHTPLVMHFSDEHDHFLCTAFHYCRFGDSIKRVRERVAQAQAALEQLKAKETQYHGDKE